MDCRQVREQVDLYLLDGLSSDEREAVRQHLAGCLSCSEQAGELDDVVRVVREGPVPAAPPIPDRFRQRVRGEVAIQQSARARPQILRYIAAVAAVVLVAVAGTWYLREPAPHPSTPSAETRQAHAPDGALKQPTTPTWSDSPSRILWQVSNTFASQKSLADTPVLVGERVFVLKRDSLERTRITAVHARTGAPLWMSEPMRVRKIAADGIRVYGLESDSPSHSVVVGLDAQNGKLLWRSVLKTSTSPLSCSLVTTANGVLMLAGGEAGLLDGEQGTTVWTRKLDVKRCPAVATCDGDRIYVATSGKLECLDGAKGTLTWSRKLTGKASHFARPCVAACGEKCYVARGLRNSTWELFCFRTGTPELLWRRVAPKATTHIVADGDVVLVRGRRIRRALATETGKQVWEHLADGCGPMSLAKGVVYYVDMSGEGALVACEARTGKPLWRERAVRSCSEVLVGGDVVYLNAQAGHLCAFRGTDYR